ncbi:MAG TPA: WD40 repeat domain-containing protein [Anaerolineae bacterium]|nr:WD40 repeat domain-containing protein [Anaerolineae bacterium]
MKNSKALFKTGCLLPVGIVIVGLIGYIFWSSILAPRISTTGACRKADGCLYTAFNGNRSVRIIGYSPDGSRFLSDGTSDGLIHDASNGRKITDLDEGRDEHSYDISGDRSQIMAYRSDSIKFFDWDGKLLRDVTPGTDQGVLDVVRLPLVDGFAIANKAGISVWDGNNSLITWLDEGGGVMQLAASANGAFLAAYNFVDDEITIWPLQNLDDAVTIKEIEALFLQLSDDGSLLVAGGPGGAFVWNTSDGSLVTSLEPDGLKAMATGFSYDGSLLAVGAENGAVSVLDVGRDELTAVFNLKSQPNRIVFAPDNTALAVGLAADTQVSGGELIFKPRLGRQLQPGGLLRTDQNRISVKPGYAVALSLADQ